MFETRPMRKITIIEHISLDGVIQAPGGPEEDSMAVLRMADGPRRMMTRREERPSSQPMATLTICCLAAEPTIYGAAIGRKPQRVRWRTA